MHCDNYKWSNSFYLIILVFTYVLIRNELLSVKVFDLSQKAKKINSERYIPSTLSSTGLEHN